MAWLERAKPIAYGELGLRPWELGQLTVSEFNAMVAGFTYRYEAQLEREAGWISMLLNGAGHLKQPITKEQILGRRPSATASTADRRRDEVDGARRKRIAERRERARTIRR